MVFLLYKLLSFMQFDRNSVSFLIELVLVVKNYGLLRSSFLKSYLNHFHSKVQLLLCWIALASVSRLSYIHFAEFMLIHDPHFSVSFFLLLICGMSCMIFSGTCFQIP